MVSRDLLASRFSKLVKNQLNEFANIDAVFNVIFDAYSEPHRCYHNLAHLQAMFNDLDGFELNSPAIEMAVWFHDIIYKPASRKNESESAELAIEQLLQLGFSRIFSSRVAGMVLATANHKCEANDVETQAFLDADMAILGASSGEYRVYLANIEREFSAVPRFLYRRGRAKFLKALLKQGRIYYADCFYHKYEQRARANIARELQSL